MRILSSSLNKFLRARHVQGWIPPSISAAAVSLRTNVQLALEGIEISLAAVHPSVSSKKRDLWVSVMRDKGSN